VSRHCNTTYKLASNLTYPFEISATLEFDVLCRSLFATCEQLPPRPVSLLSCLKILYPHLLSLVGHFVLQHVLHTRQALIISEQMSGDRLLFAVLLIAENILYYRSSNDFFGVHSSTNSPQRHIEILTKVFRYMLIMRFLFYADKFQVCM
jgi:hypothetical protein